MDNVGEIKRLKKQIAHIESLKNVSRTSSTGKLYNIMVKRLAELEKNTLVTNQRSIYYSDAIDLKTFIIILAYAFYAYIAINMIIDIKDFGDFIWFIFVGGILLAALRFVLAIILVALLGDDE